jgi:hypothetical protein
VGYGLMEKKERWIYGLFLRIITAAAIAIMIAMVEAMK